MEKLYSTLSVFMLNSLLISRLCDCHYTSSIRIKTQNGEIEGSLIETSTNRSVRVFYGIPFAQPPVGELRFKPPQPFKRQIDVLMAKKKPNACIQGTNQDEADRFPKFPVFVPINDSVSEDCLYLNIWTPTTSTNNLEVIIFIYSGAYVTGSSTLDLYDGGILASEEEVIVVTFNHRLSMFGFLYLDDNNISGNAGLMDQTMAFKWVSENIESFGGDPDKITIWGQSSSSASVNTHLFLPSSRGLFARAILDSGSVYSERFYRDINSSLMQSESLAQAVGCIVTNATDTAQCLRSKTPEELVNASISNKLQFIPTVDGVFFPYTPNEMLQRGYLNKDINILVGRNSGDGFKSTLIVSGVFNDTEDFFASEDYFTKYVIKTLGTNNTDLVESVKYLYSKDYQSGDNYRRPLVDLMTDTQVSCIVNQLAEKATKNGNKVYKYLNSYVSSASLFFKWEEVAHTSELPFIFGKPLDPRRNNYRERDVAFSKRMMKYWTSFAKFGFPSDSNLTFTYSNPKWPIYNTSSEEIYVLDEESELVSDKSSVEKCNLLLSVPTYTDIY